MSVEVHASHPGSHMSGRLNAIMDLKFWLKMRCCILNSSSSLNNPSSTGIYCTTFHILKYFSYTVVLLSLDLYIVILSLFLNTASDHEHLPWPVLMKPSLCCLFLRWAWTDQCRFVVWNMINSWYNWDGPSEEK